MLDKIREKVGGGEEYTGSPRCRFAETVNCLSVIISLILTFVFTTAGYTQTAQVLLLLAIVLLVYLYNFYLVLNKTFFP
jgi:hypothetical protein